MIDCRRSGDSATFANEIRRSNDPDQAAVCSGIQSAATQMCDTPAAALSIRVDLVKVREDPHFAKGQKSWAW